MGRSSKLEHQRRLEDTEAHMIQMFSSQQVRRALVAKYGVNPRTVSAWMAKVHQHWRDSATPEKLEERRNAIRALLENIVHQAMNRKQEIEDEEGGRRLVLDPDFRHTLHAVNQLRALDALDVQPVQKVDLSGGIGTAIRVTEDDRASLEAMLKGKKVTKKEE